MKTKYNYVIFGSGQENYLYSFHDVIKLSNAVYVYDIKAILGWQTPLFFAHICKKSNRFFKLPFKCIWNRKLFNKNPFCDEKPLCFIFFGIWENLVSTASFGNYLKKRFEGSKTVLFLQDILAKSHGLYSNNHYDPFELKRLYDVVISYDKGDCDNYHPTVFSVPNLPAENTFPETDVYFLGLVKNRYDLLINIYDNLSNKGIKCDFYIAGVAEELKIYREGIHYISFMSYTENLMRICKSKCILELMQDGATGYTFRLWEAIVMNKKLLSNNNSLMCSHFYNESFIRIINKDIDNINNILNWIMKPLENNQSLVEKISPENLLYFLDNILCE